MKIYVIIAAGGSGIRMGQPKQLLPLWGKPMLAWTVEAFRAVPEISGIVLVGAGRDLHLSELVCEPGPERTDSIRNGLKLVPKDCDMVLVHDGARPLITPAIITSAIEACKKHDAVVVGVPIKDTIKQIRKGGFETRPNMEIEKTLDRNALWAAQTPQVFKYQILVDAYKKAASAATDDSKLVEDLGIPVRMVMGSYENIKVTTPEDIIIAEAILCSRRPKKNS